MNNKDQLMSAEHIDFLAEMMNVGAGNAVTALSQLLDVEMDLKIPVVHILPAVLGESSILGQPSLPVTCARMNMVGEVTGYLHFIVQSKDTASLIQLAELATQKGEKRHGWSSSNPGEDFSVIAEIGNIISGVYLTAIHDFCKLNIYHTVPTVATDMIQALLDESLINLSRQVRHLIVAENEFIVKEKSIKTFMMIIPSAESIKILADSIDKAKMSYRK